MPNNDISGNVLRYTLIKHAPFVFDSFDEQKLIGKETTAQ
jgi:hypothetical protein